MATAPGPQPSPSPWHALPADAAILLARSDRSGLPDDEAARRLEADGPNRLPQARRRGPVAMILAQFNNVLIHVLIVAGVGTLLLGHGTDAAVIAGVIVINAAIGVVQEGKAERALDAIRRMVTPNAAVLRGGRMREIPAERVVSGDVVLLRPGDKVVADLRLIEAKGLRIEEAPLTGESLPAEKAVAPVAVEAPLAERASMAFSGTTVAAGQGAGIAVATGEATEIGRISRMLAEVPSLTTPLLRKMARFGRWLTAVILALSAATFAIGVFVHRFPPVEMVAATVGLAVAAIPEGLPAIVTIALAVGVQRMARRRAIIRKLPAVETLGSTSVICSDKTGTLTRNEMTVQAIWAAGELLEVEGIGWGGEGGFRRGGAATAPSEAARRLLEAAALCSDATVEAAGGGWTVSGDPTEAALVVAARKAGLEAAALRAGQPRLDAIPFESEHQFMATLHQRPGAAPRVLMKGAPEVVVARCPAAARAPALAQVEALAARGMRVLAVAERSGAEAGPALELAGVAGGFELLGLVGMIDPPRAEAIAAVAACRAAGIGVKMITGDHLGTARAIGGELGLLQAGGSAVTGAELARLDDAALRPVAARTNVFARVSPEQKLRLVRALQQDGLVVAMTGDGVNDAPALKQADIGVAMGITGTSVSREAADMVLTDDDFATIVAAVEEGRRVYDNLVKSLAFVLPTNLGLALIFVCAVFAFPFDAATQALLLPVRPTQLLWINLVAAVTLALPLAFEAMERDVMSRPPRDPSAPLLSTLVLRRTATVALLMTAGAVGLFLYEWHGELGLGKPAALALAEAQTMTVTSVILFQVFYLLESRSLTDSVIGASLFSNPALLPGIGAVLGLQAAFIWWPPLQRIFGTAALHAADVGTAALVAAIVFPAMAVEKALTRRAARRRSAAVKAGG